MWLWVKHMYPKMESWYLRSPGGLILTHTHVAGLRGVVFLFACQSQPWLKRRSAAESDTASSHQAWFASLTDSHMAVGQNQWYQCFLLVEIGMFTGGTIGF